MKANTKAKGEENEEDMDDSDWSSGISHHSDSLNDDVMSLKSGSSNDDENDEKSIGDDGSGIEDGDNSTRDDGSENEGDEKSSRGDASGNESDSNVERSHNDSIKNDDAEKTQEERQKEVKNADAASNSKEKPTENVIQNQVAIGQEVPIAVNQHQPAAEVVEANQIAPQIVQNTVHLAIYAGRTYKTKKSPPKVHHLTFI